MEQSIRHVMKQDKRVERISILDERINYTPSQRLKMQLFNDVYFTAAYDSKFNNWINFNKEFDWTQLRHIFTKQLELSDKFMDGVHSWTVLGSCDCSHSDGSHKHRHYLVTLHEEWTNKLAMKTKYKFLRSIGKSREEAKRANGLIERIVTPNCYLHALNMLMYLHKPTGVRANEEHVHSNGKSCYLGDLVMDNSDLRVQLQAIAFRSIISEDQTMHLYPPIQFDKRLVFLNWCQEDECKCITACRFRGSHAVQSIASFRAAHLGRRHEKSGHGTYKWSTRNEITSTANICKPYVHVENEQIGDPITEESLFGIKRRSTDWLGREIREQDEHSDDEHFA